MGMEVNTEEVTPAKQPAIPQVARYPPMPTKNSHIHRFKKPINTPIHIRLTEAPTRNEINAKAAKMECPTKGYGIIEEMKLDKEEVFAQVYLSPSPYHEAFEEKLDIRQWSSTNEHRTAGLSIIKNQDRLIPSKYTAINTRSTNRQMEIKMLRSMDHGDQRNPSE
jgi:hypothetical protein